jgi:hypothetical protein
VPRCPPPSPAPACAQSYGGRHGPDGPACRMKGGPHGRTWLPHPHRPGAHADDLRRPRLLGAHPWTAAPSRALNRSGATGDPPTRLGALCDLPAAPDAVSDDRLAEAVAVRDAGVENANRWDSKIARGGRRIAIAVRPRPSDAPLGADSWVSFQPVRVGQDSTGADTAAPGRFGGVESEVDQPIQVTLVLAGLPDEALSPGWSGSSARYRLRRAPHSPASKGTSRRTSTTPTGSPGSPEPIGRPSRPGATPARGAPRGRTHRRRAWSRSGAIGEATVGSPSC